MFGRKGRKSFFLPFFTNLICIRGGRKVADDSERWPGYEFVCKKIASSTQFHNSFLFVCEKSFRHGKKICRTTIKKPDCRTN